MIEAHLRQFLTDEFMLKVKSMHKLYNSENKPYHVLPDMKNILDVYHGHFIPVPRRLPHYGFSADKIKVILDYFMGFNTDLEAEKWLAEQSKVQIAEIPQTPEKQPENTQEIPIVEKPKRKTKDGNKNNPS